MILSSKQVVGDAAPHSNSQSMVSSQSHAVSEHNIAPPRHLSHTAKSGQQSPSPRSSHESLVWSEPAEDPRRPSTPNTEPQLEDVIDKVTELSPAAAVTISSTRERRASTSLITQDSEELRRILGPGETGTKLIKKYCCGGGCCLTDKLGALNIEENEPAVPLPDNDAFRSLQLNLGHLSLDTELTNITELPPVHVSFGAMGDEQPKHVSTVQTAPPAFVQPHPPYHVYSTPVYSARELTKPGAEKRTFHFDLDVTDYPDEGGVDFKVGGAIGIVPPNDMALVDDIFDQLGVPRFLRDKQFVLKTESGRWPTIWGEDEPRELVTTRRELLTWCCDIQSTPPTKPLLRLLAEYADDACEKKILMYLVAAEGQGAFCDLRTGPHVTLAQMLHAFPSSHPPLASIFSVMKQLMPRFYSLSNDPHVSAEREGTAGRRLIEMAVSVHETADWERGTRTGVGSGYLERIAQQHAANPSVQLTVPMFRGLMANPLSREFVSDGPMMLVGAGVGIAPFRGFILNRLKNANCANKVWLVQGVRDSSLDELYQGELGQYESDVKKVVQSRKANTERGEAKYVQEELHHQADVVWFVINAVDGRIFVCGSSKGMGEGVQDALVQIAMKKANLNRDQAEKFWEGKKEGGQYITETW